MKTWENCSPNLTKRRNMANLARRAKQKKEGEKEMLLRERVEALLDPDPFGKLITGETQTLRMICSKKRFWETVW